MSGLNLHNKSITLSSHDRVDLGSLHQYRYVTEKAHSTTYTLASGTSATQSQDMGTRHNYRYAKWPYTTYTIKGTLTCTNQLYNSTTGGTYGAQGTKTSTVTITGNIITKAKPSISGGSTANTSSANWPAQVNYGCNAVAKATFTISSISFS